MFVFKDTIFSYKRNIRFQLAKVYGIGYQKSSKIADLIGISNYLFMDRLNYFFFELFSMIFKLYYITDDRLKFLIRQQMQKFLEIKSIRGIRFSRGLPVRGQRTHTNCKQNKYYKRNEI
jgi:small subunit ribosomal protein S13